MQVRPLIILWIQSLFLFALVYCPPAFSKKACIKNSLGKIHCGELQTLIKQPDKKFPTEYKKIVKTKSGVDFILNGCKNYNTALVCSISVYNSTEYDKHVNYGNYFVFSIIDSEGNEYKASSDSGSSEFSMIV
jgi:hypothetical protein